MHVKSQTVDCYNCIHWILASASTRVEPQTTLAPGTTRSQPVSPSTSTALEFTTTTVIVSTTATSEASTSSRVDTSDVTTPLNTDSTTDAGQTGCHDATNYSVVYSSGVHAGSICSIGICIHRILWYRSIIAKKNGWSCGLTSSLTIYRSSDDTVQSLHYHSYYNINIR